MDFQRALTQAYRERPCQVLPNALWKTLSDLPGMKVDYQEVEGIITHLEILDSERLLLYWDRERDELHVPAEKLATKRLALVHDDYMPSISKSWIPGHRLYFRLTHKGPLPAQAADRFLIRPVLLPLELVEVADFLNRCYGGKNMTAGQVQAWTRHPVYDPHLWIWVEEGGQTAGLGIAEFDGSVPEGSLEWIQVLPAFRRRGVGRAVVLELLRRLVDRAAFITVSGQKASDGSGAEALYRSCGFEGHDVWWLLQKS